MLTSEDALRHFLVLSKGLGTLCENTLGKSSILEYVATAVMCRDLVEKVDRIDDLREKEIASLKRCRIEHEHELRTEGN
jgi:hypothetical protein